MNSSILFSPDQIASLEGGESARIISIAFFALFVYEWLITLDDEIKYFWTGPWTASRALFFLNRYVPFFLMILALGCFFVPIPTVEFCKPAIQTGIIANIGALGIIQAILVLRVWYLFSSSRPIRLTMLIAFMISFILSLAFAIVSAADLEVLPHPPGVRVAVGCQAARPDHFWRMFFPSLVLHTLLYILTAVKALRNRQVLKDAPVLKRLLRDGGFFFFVVFVSVGFTSIGSFLTAYPRINIPIVFSDYLISITSIAVSRVMFSIHSLAENLGSDTAWLLNNAELSRVGWRQGSTRGEIIIERWSDEYDDEARFTDAEAQRASPIKMTRIGTFDNLPWKTTI